MKLRGTMLTPGVSKNGRLYTPELIRKAHDRLTERITAGASPVTMLTHHAAGDNSTKIVGQVTAVHLDGDNLNYEAELADTADAATIGSLVSATKPFLRNVSVRGWWVGPTQSKNLNGQPVETADDLEIDGLDFTRSPGVTGATVTPVSGSGTTETTERVLVTESVEACAVFTETTEANKQPYGDVTYADPGYQKDGQKRYPINTKARAKAAWSYINQKDNADLYTAAQLKRVRGRIKAALKKFGVTVTAESLARIATISADTHLLVETATSMSDVTECVDGTGTAGFCISAYNGPLTVTVSAYNGIEPADLAGVAQCAMLAACDAIHAMDPDDDGDIDSGADSDETDDNQMETEPEKEATVAETESTTSIEAAEATAGQDDVATDTAETATADGDVAAPEFVTAQQLADAVQQAVAAALAAAAADTESAAADGEPTEESTADTDQVDEAALRASIRDEIIAEARRTGSLTRKGLVETMGDPDKPLHEMSDEEFRAYQQSRAGLFFAHNPQ